jgi:hypothetical protein
MQDRTTTITNPRKVPINANGQRVLAASADAAPAYTRWVGLIARGERKRKDLNDVPGASLGTSWSFVSMARRWYPCQQSMAVGLPVGRDPRGGRGRLS